MDVSSKKGAVVRNSVVLAEVTVGENVHVENEVVDKWAKLSVRKKSFLRLTSLVISREMILCNW